MSYSHSNSRKLISKIDVAAFVSIMVLLMFSMVLMVMTQASHAGHGSLQLPRVNNQTLAWGADKEDALIVAVLRDGGLFFCNDHIASDQLTTKIKNRLGRHADDKVYIRADAQVHYGAIKAVLDGVRDAGIEKVIFLVDENRRKAR